VLCGTWLTSRRQIPLSLQQQLYFKATDVLIHSIVHRVWFVQDIYGIALKSDKKVDDSTIAAVRGADAGQV